MVSALLVFVVSLCLLLMDATVLFLLLRLLVTIIPARPLLRLNRIGDAGVEAVTDAVMDRTRRWFRRPLTRTQEYAFTLFLLSAARWLLGAALAIVTKKGI